MPATNTPEVPLPDYAMDWISTELAPFQLFDRDPENLMHVRIWVRHLLRHSSAGGVSLEHPSSPEQVHESTISRSHDAHREPIPDTGVEEHQNMSYAAENQLHTNARQHRFDAGLT